jgi:hypothetical protein
MRINLITVGPDNKMRTSILISVALLVIGVSASYVIAAWDVAALPVAAKASTLVSLWACVAALISAAFVVRSYLQTNRAFVLSQKPHLRIWVQNMEAKTSEQDPTRVHMTAIHYENMTLNPFLDLTIGIKVKTSKATIDLSDLFKPRMFMSGRDQRQRTFPTRKELLARGFELSSPNGAQDPPILCISYSFTFDKRTESIEIQKYSWDASRNQWSLE